MYNPEHYYEQHMRHLRELREQAAYDRMAAALARDKPSGLRAALGRAVAFGATLGAWLAWPARRCEQPACTC